MELGNSVVVTMAILGVLKVHAIETHIPRGTSVFLNEYVIVLVERVSAERAGADGRCGIDPMLTA